MSTPFAIVTTTLGDAKSAKTLARALVEARLAACVQIVAIDSVYRWQGAVETADEFMLVCKVRADDYPEVEAAIRDRHIYDTPEIISVKVDAGASSYLDWIVQSTSR